MIKKYSDPLLRKFSLFDILLVFTMLSGILYFGKTLFIPLAFAMLISFILYPACIWLEKKGTNPTLAIAISMLALLLFFACIISLFIIQVKGFLGEWNALKSSLFNSMEKVSNFLSLHLNISSERQKLILKNISVNTGSQVIPFLKITAWSFSVSIVIAVIIPVFSILILHYRKMLTGVLYSLFPPEKKKSIRAVLQESVHAYNNFIKGMLLVYLIVGILNSIGLAIIGIPHPVLFGFIASILTFIPYIGIMIASLLPIAVSWVTFNSALYPLGVILVFSIVQLLEAYIIFPFAVSSRLKINTLAILVIIIGGGILWGAAGMILFIPIFSIIKLIAERTKSLKNLSRLLSSG